MGETGSVSFQFDHVGSITYSADKGDAEAMLDVAIEAGASECLSDEDGHEFLSAMEDFGAVRDALEAKLGEPTAAKILWKPTSMVAVDDEAGETLSKLLDTLDDHDDVQNIYANCEFSDLLMEKLSAA